jgi:hypothetical protein
MREIMQYDVTAESLRRSGWPIVLIDTSANEPHEVARKIIDHVHVRCASSTS